MKLFSLPALAGVSFAAAIANPFDTLTCFNPEFNRISPTKTTSTTQSSISLTKGWVTTSDGLVTSYDYNDASSTVWVFPTGSGNHEATKIIYRGVQIINVSFVVIVVEVVDSQPVIIVSSDSSSTSIHSTASTVTSVFTTSSNPTIIEQAKATHMVDVGAGDGFSYSPSQVNAAIGDTVRFNFLGRNHSVTQSELTSPCTYNGAFDTGLNQFNPFNISGKFVVDYQINVSTPLWFYCKQPGPPSHCSKRMVFAINPADHFNQFSRNAEAQGQALSILEGIGNASSFSINATNNIGFNSTTRKRYQRYM